MYVSINKADKVTFEQLVALVSAAKQAQRLLSDTTGPLGKAIAKIEPVIERSRAQYEKEKAKSRAYQQRLKDKAFANARKESGLDS